MLESRKKTLVSGLFILQYYSLLSFFFRRFGLISDLKIIVSVGVKLFDFIFILNSLILIFRNKDVEIIKKIRVINILLIITSIVTIFLDVIIYRNTSYYLYGISLEIAYRLCFYCVIQLLIIGFSKSKHMIIIVSHGFKDIFSAVLKIVKKIDIETKTIILLFTILLTWSICKFDILLPEVKTYDDIYGEESIYIKSLELLDDNCPIIHPPYDDIYPQEKRWKNIKIQPILRSALFPRVLVNPVILNDGVVTEMLKKYKCYYLHTIETEGKEWPLIKDNSIYFDRYFSVGFRIKDLTIVSSDKLGKIVKFNFMNENN